MERGRKRRRQTCSKCGRSFACSWINNHRQVCGTTQPSTDSTVEAQNIDIENVRTPDYGEDQEMDSTAIEDIVEETRYEEEDQDFFERFETEESTTEENVSLNPVEPPAEIWDDVEESEGDFERCEDASEDSASQDQNQSPNHDHKQTKIEVLVMWMMLFLASWQSQHGVTDTALAVFIKFICQFFWLLGMIDTTMESLSKLFPKSHYKLKKALGITNDDFYKYVVCPKCKTLYKYEDCFDVRSGRKVSAKCKFVPWPNHPHSRKGKELKERK